LHVKIPPSGDNLAITLHATTSIAFNSLGRAQLSDPAKSLDLELLIEDRLFVGVDDWFSQPKIDLRDSLERITGRISGNDVMFKQIYFLAGVARATWSPRQEHHVYMY
jgi:hypothetical protein